ncbi:class I SAM-dependent methyltransferase [Chloroflexota bacterium]
MNLIKAFAEKKREVGLKEAMRRGLRFAGNRAATQYYSLLAGIDYRFNKNALKQSIVNLHINNEEIKREFIESGFPVIDYHIDKEDFSRWLREIRFPADYSLAYREAFTEKALEHYLAAKILELNDDDVFIDVAASFSPWYELSEKYYKCSSYAVDLLLPPDKNDPRLIQCDATSMPFEDGSITRMALHCALEMFENEDDTNLVKEAARVLKPGGRLVISPLYMRHFYGIWTGLKANRKGIEYGKAKRVWEDIVPRRRFCRYYDVGAFQERISGITDKMNAEIYYITNENEVKQAPEDLVYIKFVACLTRN